MKICTNCQTITSDDPSSGPSIFCPNCQSPELEMVLDELPFYENDYLTRLSEEMIADGEIEYQNLEA